jgi:hypothetical protein
MVKRFFKAVTVATLTVALTVPAVTINKVGVKATDRLVSTSNENGEVYATDEIADNIDTASGGEYYSNITIQPKEVTDIKTAEFTEFLCIDQYNKYMTSGTPRYFYYDLKLDKDSLVNLYLSYTLCSIGCGDETMETTLSIGSADGVDSVDKIEYNKITSLSGSIDDSNTDTGVLKSTNMGVLPKGNYKLMIKASGDYTDIDAGKGEWILSVNTQATTLGTATATFDNPLTVTTDGKEYTSYLTPDETENMFKFTLAKASTVTVDSGYTSLSGDEGDYVTVDVCDENYKTVTNGSSTLTASNKYKNTGTYELGSGTYYVYVNSNEESYFRATGIGNLSVKVNAVAKPETNTTTASTTATNTSKTSSSTTAKKKLAKVSGVKVNFKKKTISGKGTTGAKVYVKYKGKTYTKTVKKGKWSVKVKGKLKKGKGVSVYQSKKGYTKSATVKYKLTKKSIKKVK